MTWVDLVDVALVGILLWVGISWLRRSRARFALLGVAAVGVVYLVARRLDLELTSWILQGFFAVSIVFVVVVFQEDLRRLFEGIAIWGLGRRTTLVPGSAADSIVKSVEQMAADRTGGLIVIPGREPAERFLEGGTTLDAWISEPLLLSLFDSSSPGHDGAVVMSGRRISRFGVHLPLSVDRALVGAGGTRHAAALGLSERSDAFCIVVSEERGTISFARNGRLHELESAGDLLAELQPFLARASAPRSTRRAAIRQRLPEGALAMALAVVLWFLLVPGASVVEVEHLALVKVENLPHGFEVISVEPREVVVTLSGQRRRLVIEDLDGVEVRVDALLAELGRRTFEISADQIEPPEGISVVSISPKSVKLSLRRPSGG